MVSFYSYTLSTSKQKNIYIICEKNLFLTDFEW